MVNIYEEIEALIQYALHHHLIEKEDVIYTRNRLLAALQLDEWQPPEGAPSSLPLPAILSSMLDWAYEQGLLQTN
ncbi:MAG: galactose-1-phosphate uridylyltransferase, partial [Anoxybacillus ayderensis]|nr:galactose-1-phosphate uridylyltransferase [Anoxybacillus ayderensis]